MRNTCNLLFTIILLISLCFSSCNKVEKEVDRHYPGLSPVLAGSQPDGQFQELREQYELLQAENESLKDGYRIKVIYLLLGCVSLCVMQLYLTKEQKSFFRREVTEEKNHIQLEKQQIESALNLSAKQIDNLQELLFRYDLFLRFRVEQQLLMRKNANRVRSKYPALGDAYDNMMEKEREQFNELVDKLFTVEDMQRLFGVDDEEGVLTKNDRLLLFMLANHADNEQIAALFNITADNLKSRKSYLKRKIMEKTTNSNGFQHFLELF